MVISNSEEIIEKVRRLKAFGINTPPELRTKPGVYDVHDLGYNYRMTDFQAAAGERVARWSAIPETFLNRRKNARKYCELLKNTMEISFTDYSDEHSCFLFFKLFWTNPLTGIKFC